MAGHIGTRDVILLGIVYVSPGRVMPLLQVRPDFGEYESTSTEDGELIIIRPRQVFAA